MTQDTSARMKELDEKEEMMRVGKVVKIEPMPKRVVPVPLPAEISKNETTKDDRRKIADRIVELSDGVLERPRDTKRHISLKIGAGPYSNAVTISKYFDRVNFFILSADLLRKAEAEGFKPETVESTRPWPKDRFRFWGLGLGDIQAHEALFREIVVESVRAIMDRKPRRN